MRILFLDIDSMRPDHFGCYGYHRNTTPNLDSVAREGVRFSGAYCNSSPCVPSRGSLLSGRYGVNHGAMTHWGPGSQFDFPGLGHEYYLDRPLLSRYLRQHGYCTVSFSSFADRHQANWFYAGWSEFHTPSLKGGEENADEVNARLLPWIRDNAAHEDLFLHVQYWDPHRNYTVGPEWPKLFESDAPPEWPDDASIETHLDNAGPFSASELFPHGDGLSPVDTMPDRIANRSDFKRFVDGYDGAIRFMDDQIGEVFQALDDMGLLDDTAVIVSADHGEAMGEQGIYGDHVCAGEAVHNIPLIVRWPGTTPADRCYDGLLYNVDLLPTLSDLLDLPTPSGWDGRSFAPAVRGGTWSGRSHLVWDHALYSCQRAVRTPRWLYTRTYHPGLYPFEEEALHEMTVDPHQERNVAGGHTDVVDEMEARMNDWLHDNVSKGRVSDPMEEVLTSGPFRYVGLDYWIERLQNRGRGDAAQATLDRLPAASRPGRGGGTR